MRIEPQADKIVLSKEDYRYYQQRRKECKVYDPREIGFNNFKLKSKSFKKKY